MYTRISQSRFTNGDWDCFEKAWVGVRKGDGVNRDRDWFIDAHRENMHSIHSHSSADPNPNFLPWHRQFLVSFERAARKVESGFTLPFWNATRRHKIPDALKKDLFGWMKSGSRGFNGDWLEQQVNPALVEDILRESTFDRFTSRLEFDYHNHVHEAFNGAMGDITKSPKDPLFWLHHCFVDKIWAEWQKRNPSVPHPMPSAALKPWSDKTVKDVLDTDDLGYKYGSLSILDD